MNILKLLKQQENTFKTIINNLHQRCADLEHNDLENGRKITKMSNIILNQEKRIVWCEENLKTNFKVKTPDNRYLKPSADGKFGYVVDSNEEEDQDICK